MGRLNRLETKVLTELKMKPCTRDDDRELALNIWLDYYGVSPWAPVAEVMHRRDIPSQESIGRCRRKIQEKYESLRGTKHKEKIRMQEQERYLEYARE